MDDIDLTERTGSTSLPAKEVVDFFTAWVVQMMRWQQHNMLLWGDAWRKCL